MHGWVMNNDTFIPDFNKKKKVSDHIKTKFIRHA